MLAAFMEQAVLTNASCCIYALGQSMLHEPVYIFICSLNAVGSWVVEVDATANE
jgi:hypothetical protein